MLEGDFTPSIQRAVGNSYKNKSALQIVGMGSKHSFNFPVAEGTRVLDLSNHRGVLDYQPSELTITARAGTSVAEINATLKEFRQHIACEVPMMNSGGSIGGAVATGWSGPGSAFRGKLRDFVLGVKLMNGKGEILNFGGKVLKNVAGFDVSRLLCGSYGSLGVILEVSLKVSPQPHSQHTFIVSAQVDEGIRLMHQIAAQEANISAACWSDERLYLRFDDVSAKQLARRIGGEQMAEDEAGTFWRRLRDHKSKFFSMRRQQQLWALVCSKSTTPDLQLPGDSLIDQCGALRWYVPEAALELDIFLQELHARKVRAHLLQSSSAVRPCFIDIPRALRGYYQRIKTAFDPSNILNPGVLGF